MTSEQRAQIQAAIRKAPKTVWGYWPFLIPVLVVLVGIGVNAALFFYFQGKAPDLEILFKRGKTVVPVWGSDLIRQAVMLTSMSFALTFALFALVARQAFGYLTLLRAVAKDVGADEG